MDFLQGIPVEYKLDAFNMPRTGTTLCHPKIGYVDQSVIPLATQAPISPLVHINGDNAYSPPNTRHETHSDIQSSIPHVRQLTLPSQHLMTPFRLNTNKPKLHESCSTKSKPYSMLQ